MTAPFITFEDFTPGRVMEYGAHTITAEEIVEFASEFDPQPMHLSQEGGLKAGVGGLIASGWQSAALTMRMTCDELIGRSTSLGSPGLDEILWLKPVRPGDRLRVRLEVLGARLSASRPELGIVNLQFDLINQHDETVLTQRSAAMFGVRATLTEREA